MLGLCIHMRMCAFTCGQYVCCVHVCECVHALVVSACTYVLVNISCWSVRVLCARICMCAFTCGQCVCVVCMYAHVCIYLWLVHAYVLVYISCWSVRVLCVRM